ncbi:DNA polymerase III subunit epsilon [Halarcobacter mediterraneus]|uniref:DNA polymerase III subunit epsilon n=1 Tax=Halarcobacter mediterraneus TaxID=2023153 RepID=A0A4Q1AUZ0_9BACT|nr:3'-5' exonuclease [Halarcobacter mediterraneus]RXK13964.1 DNA polymerase III subunit epsilon [Halarcobacter mediterraneus]
MTYNRNFYNNLTNKLKKAPIDFDEFLEILKKNKEKFFDNPELEFELLLSNGFPLEIEDNKVFLKTSQTKIEEQTFCIVDIETNGGHVNKGHQIIEIGAVKYKNDEIIDSFESLVYAKDIPEYIQGVTNITPKMLVNAPCLKKVLEDFKVFLEDDVFVAHDIKFDYNFISNSLEKYNLGKLHNRKLCTIDLARRTIKAEKYGLKSLKEVLHIKIDNHHRAYSDALSTTYILQESLKHISKEVSTVEELIDFSKNAKPIMPKIQVNQRRNQNSKKEENKEEK